jgi:hypothetical protein
MRPGLDLWNLRPFRLRYLSGDRFYRERGCGDMDAKVGKMCIITDFMGFMQLSSLSFSFFILHFPFL